MKKQLAFLLTLLLLAPTMAACGDTAEETAVETTPAETAPEETETELTDDLPSMDFGGVGFVAASYEMFSKSGIYIKDNSPFEFTIVSTVTNGYNNYYPSEEAFAYGCYESYTAIFATGVAEACAEKFVQMLESVK